jgi:outer membrane biosynthesis protein TonB
VRAGRFGELDHSDLIHLLESLDDERSKARFRESIYVSLFFWMAVVALIIFAPRVFPRTPEFIVPTGDLKDQKLTSLTVPPEVQKAINNVPKVKPSPRPAAAGGPSAPAPKAPAVQQAPPEPPPAQPRQSPQPTAPPPVVQQSPLPQAPPAQTAALPSAPAPSVTPTRPNFGNPNTSARDMVQQATRAPHGGGGVTIGGGPGGPVEHRGLGTGVDILSDTEGVDFNPYLQKIMREIYETWLPLIPEEARPPLNKQGETQIRFIILPDGRIGGMALEGSTHDDAINKSCWGSITGVGQFPALPSQFHGPKLELRVHYLVNKETR